MRFPLGSLSKLSSEISLSFSDNCVEIHLDRENNNNSLNAEILSIFLRILDEAEECSDCRVLIFRGKPGFFCTGLDLNVMSEDEFNSLNAEQDWSNYADLLERFSSSSLVIISAVDGSVIAGGVGIVAASDLVFATNRSQFRLTEAMWGLLPANVTPYLIRRVGYQTALRLALTTETISATEATRQNLVDYLVNDLNVEIKKKKRLIGRLQKTTVGELKTFFKSMWYLDGSKEAEANRQMRQSMERQDVRHNINRYLESGYFPWE